MTFLLCTDFNAHGEELERYSKVMSDDDLTIYFTTTERKLLANGKTIVHHNDERDVITHFMDLNAH